MICCMRVVGVGPADADFLIPLAIQSAIFRTNDSHLHTMPMFLMSRMLIAIKTTSWSVSDFPILSRACAWISLSCVALSYIHISSHVFQWLKDVPG